MTHKESRKKREQEEQEKWSLKLREVYKASGLTKKEISRITGINFNTLVSWLGGYRMPSPQKAKAVIEKISGYFDSDRKEYIDKAGCRPLFISRVYTALTTKNPEHLGKAIIEAYDSLPSVSSPRKPKENE